MLKIRLKPIGKIGNVSYRIVVVDQKKKRDGRVVDTLGYYNPKSKPVELKFEMSKIEQWMSQGAVPTETARKLLKIL